MKRFVFLIILVLSVFIAFSAQAQLTVYDDFSGPYLSPDRWYVYNQYDITITSMEGGLRIKSGKLGYYSRNFGGEESDSGRPRARRRLVMQNGLNVTAMETSVQVKGLEVTGCANNTTPSRAEVRIGGAFFNDVGICEGEGSVTGDVQAYIGLRKDTDDPDLPSGYMRAIGTVLRCNNSGCTDTTEIGTQDLGLVKVGKKVKLLMRIEKAQDRFVFKLDKKGAEVPISYSGYSDAANPCGDSGGLKRLEVTHLLANCQTGPATYGWLDTYYDYLSVSSP
jgi:hypothetical protein